MLKRFILLYYLICKSVCFDKDLANSLAFTTETLISGDSTEPTSASLPTVVQTTTTAPPISCWYDTSTEPYHSNSAESLQCLCGDTCITGVINGSHGIGYFWQCGCEMGGQTPYYLCPTNTQFDEYLCCKGDSCNAGNWTEPTTALTTTTIQTPSTSPPFISCWYDGSFEPYHSNSAVALQCLCGDTCIAGVINGSTVGYFWQCGCELGSQEYHLCPTNNQYNEYVCCKGNLCNAGNWTEPMITSTIDATTGTTNPTTATSTPISTSTTTQLTTASSISQSTNPSITTKATTVITTTTLSTTATTSATPTTSSKQTISLFIVLTTVIWCFFLSDTPKN